MKQPTFFGRFRNGLAKNLPELNFQLLAKINNFLTKKL